MLTAATESMTRTMKSSIAMFIISAPHNKLSVSIMQYRISQLASYLHLICIWSIANNTHWLDKIANKKFTCRAKRQGTRVRPTKKMGMYRRWKALTNKHIVDTTRPQTKRKTRKEIKKGRIRIRHSWVELGATRYTKSSHLTYSSIFNVNNIANFIWWSSVWTNEISPETKYKLDYAAWSVPTGHRRTTTTANWHELMDQQHSLSRRFNILVSIITRNSWTKPSPSQQLEMCPTR